MPRNRSSFQAGNSAGKARVNRRLTRGDLAPYRARFIAGETIKELAPDIVAEFGYDTVEHATYALQRRCTGEGWLWQRQAFRDHAAAIVLAKNERDLTQGYLDRVAVDGDHLLTSGLEALRRLQPATVTEALDMIRVGAQLGLRGRNLPDKVAMPTIVPLLPPTEPAVVQAVQQLSPGSYEALAASVDADFAEFAPGFAAPGGDR